MRWDKADKTGYYYQLHSGNHLTTIVDVVNNSFQTCAVSVSPDVVDCIEHTYDTVVSILKTASSIYMPRFRKGLFKFWWNEEVNLFQEASVESAGKPRDGPIFANRQSYRLCIHERMYKLTSS